MVHKISNQEKLLKRKIIEVNENVSKKIEEIGDAIQRLRKKLRSFGKSAERKQQGVETMKETVKKVSETAEGKIDHSRSGKKRASQVPGWRDANRDKGRLKIGQLVTAAKTHETK